MIAVPDSNRLVLASGSPRRRQLMESVGLVFTVRPADIDETPQRVEAPLDYVRRLSIEKAEAAMSSPSADPGDIVVAADTTVEVDGAILEKPLDPDDARGMLHRLSGRSHRAHTGVSVAWPESGVRRTMSVLVSTEVTFVQLSDDMIEWYLATGEADDKAGAYGIQGAAAGFVERIDGSVTNVIGLPLAETLAMIRTAVASSAR